MFLKFSQTLSLVTLAVAIAACSGEQSKKAETNEVDKTSTERTSAVVACSGMQGTTSVTASNMQLDGNVEGFNTSYRFGAFKPLCVLLKDAQVPVGIFQFAGVRCLSCQDEAKAITALLKTAPKRTSIKHFLVFVDPASAGLDDEIPLFIKDFTAGQGLAVFEPGKKLFLKYSVNSKGEADFGGSFAMNLIGSYYHYKPNPDLGALSTLVNSASDLVP
jgi:hypothetical protein